MLITKEHYDLLAQFEREHSGRFDKEAKEFWPRGIIYQDGRVNEQFLAYRRGYAFAVADYRSDLQNLEASRDGYRRDAERLQSEIDNLKAAEAQPGAQKDGGDCAKGAGDGDLHFIAGTIVQHLNGPLDPARVIAASRAIKDWIDRQQLAALSPTPSVVKQSLTATQTGEKGEKDA
ncbi:hypothetical protein LMG6103_03578 [Achromobacter piechaudii]|nr:hypothetical protein LMG6103_03578 [Achromobacter piechaudii]